MGLLPSLHLPWNFHAQTTAFLEKPTPVSSRRLGPAVTSACIARQMKGGAKVEILPTAGPVNQTERRMQADHSIFPHIQLPPFISWMFVTASLCVCHWDTSCSPTRTLAGKALTCSISFEEGPCKWMHWTGLKRRWLTPVCLEKSKTFHED